jgi:hypothetical protein
MFAKIFVAMNRVFGVTSLVMGTVLVLGAIVRVSLYGPGKEFWILGVAGVLLIPVGILYMKAPLTRSQSGSRRYRK